MMEDPLDGFAEVARQVHVIGESRKAAARLLHEKKPSGMQFDFLEESLSIGFDKSPFSGSVIAVDGGIVAGEFHSMDLFAYRSCAAVFGYDSGVLKKHGYYPNAMPRPRFEARHSLQSHEFNWVKGLLRLNSEISCALEATRAHAPNVVFLDGSIVPQVSDKPAADSEAFSLYESLLRNLYALYEHCNDNGIALAGVIKDSRGRHFLDLLTKGAPALLPYRDALSKSSDTAFLTTFLAPGTRTCAFKYASSPSETSVLKDLGEWGRKVSCFYIRPVEFDRPLRVDFLTGSSESISRVAHAVGSLSAINRSYGYPAVLIEADLRAAMLPEEIEYFHSRLAAQMPFDAESMQLRRNSRPFR